jgi:hypothetical protein
MRTDNNDVQEALPIIQGLFEDMLEISFQQKQLLESDQEISWPMDAMLELQDKRQDIMQRLDELNFFFGTESKLSSLELWADGGGDCSASDVDNCRDMLQQIKNVIMAIDINDHCCQEKLEKGKQKMMSKLSQVRENKKAQVAYIQEDAYEPAWFFDKKK